MLISLEWLGQYVDVPSDLVALADRFSMTGLNHESTEVIGGDTVFDLEVTSNRGDCLSHIGVAREVSALYGTELKVPSNLSDKLESDSASDYLSIVNEFPDGCPQYTARIIRNVTIGPSPDWLVNRLKAVGVESVNNVVDITNYVMLESGQPLHAFDLATISDATIRIRSGKPKESFEAIDHKTYELDRQTVVIADSKSPIAIGGVMGGAESEVSETTTDLVIEAAEFMPQLIRQTARRLKLHSQASYRFERRIDRLGLDWASLRCCQLIAELAGGQVLNGIVTAGKPDETRPSVPLRQSQIQKVLGIVVPWEESQSILTSLGCTVSASKGESGQAVVEIIPPTWRNDLPREVDLIEEVARVYGYEKIPEDVSVPSGASAKRPKDYLFDRTRQLCNAVGLDESMTPSVVTKNEDAIPSAWTDFPALELDVALLKGATRLRRSIVPSLLQSFVWNQSQSVSDARLFETAVVYLPHDKSGDGLPSEKYMLGVVTQDNDPETGLRSLRGLFDEIIRRSVSNTAAAGLGYPEGFSATAEDCEIVEPGSGLKIYFGSDMIGWLGLLVTSWKTKLKITSNCLVGELNLDALLSQFQAVPALTPISAFPSVERDLNFILDEGIRWLQIREIISGCAGPLLKDLQYRETYRDAKRDGAGKKRILLSLSLQSDSDTLSSHQADEVVAKVVQQCGAKIGAKVLG
jgi:phenylalanyl-tRNA synthetase beta chain